jgi:hypothetical protein
MFYITQIPIYAFMLYIIFGTQQSLEAENKKLAAKGKPIYTEEAFQKELKRRRNISIIICVVCILASTAIHLFAN